MITKNYFTHAKIKSFVRAGFFTRNGGVSKKENYSLNCSLNQKDTKVNVNKNIDIYKIFYILGIIHSLLFFVLGIVFFQIKKKI